MTGALDEPAHLATTALALAAAADPATLRRHRPVVLSALAATVLIDVDHLPMYAGIAELGRRGRPYSHSVTTVAALAVIGAVLPRGRRVLSGAALGIGLHFLRDLGTGPGLPLWWPIRAGDVRVPYAGYLAGLAGLAGVATGRAALPRR